MPESPKFPVPLEPAPAPISGRWESTIASMWRFRRAPTGAQRCGSTKPAIEVRERGASSGDTIDGGGPGGTCQSSCIQSRLHLAAGDIDDVSRVHRNIGRLRTQEILHG